MNPTAKRAVLAAAISLIAAPLLGTPELITEVLIFVPTFGLTFGLLWLGATLSKKSQIVNRKS
jgi:hypothetical protein